MFFIFNVVAEPSKVNLHTERKWISLWNGMTYWIRFDKEPFEYVSPLHCTIYEYASELSPKVWPISMTLRLLSKNAFKSIFGEKYNLSKLRSSTVLKIKRCTALSELTNSMQRGLYGCLVTVDGSSNCPVNIMVLKYSPTKSGFMLFICELTK